MGYRTCHFSSLGVQGFLAEVAMGTTEIFKCPGEAHDSMVPRQYVSGGPILTSAVPFMKTVPVFPGNHAFIPESGK